jgi:hypothetical protein
MPGFKHWQSRLASKTGAAALGRLRSVVILRDFLYWQRAMLARPSAFGRNQTLRRLIDESSHTLMYRICRFIAVVTCITCALFLSFPLALYLLGLNGVEGRPQKPLLRASVEQKTAVWKLAQGDGIPYVKPNNPYIYAASVFFTRGRRTSPDQLVTWWVARDYLVGHKRYKGMGWWHLSGASLAIWLSRNWTSDEILSAAAQLRQSPQGR